MLFISLCGFGQVHYNEEGTIFYEKVFDADSLNKSEIKEKVNEWLALNFNDSNNVIKMNSEDKIVSKGIITLPYEYREYRSEYKINFDLITDFKDGRYKVLIDNLESSTMPSLILNEHFLTLDEYEIMALEMAKKIGTYRGTKKLIEKDKFSDFYEQAKKMNDLNMDKLKLELIAIGESIDKAVKNASKGDW